MAETPKSSPQNNAPDSAPKEPEKKDVPKNPEDMTKDEMIAELKKRREEEGNKEVKDDKEDGKEKPAGSPERLNETMSELFEAILELIQEKFFPKKNKDGSVSVPEVDSLTGGGGEDETKAPKDAPEGKDNVETAEEAEEALKKRAAETAKETASQFDHPTFTRRPPKNEEVRPFYRQGPDGMIKEKWQYNSSTTEWTQVGSQTTGEIRTELQARRAQRDAERQAARNSDPEGDQILAMWRSGKYGSFLRRRENRRYVENNLGISVGSTSKAPDGGPYQKFSNYRVNDYAQEARRQAEEKIKAPLTDEERAEAEANLKKYGLFQNMPNRNNEVPPSSAEGAYAQAEAAPERNRPTPLHTESVEVKGIRGMGAEDVKIPIVIPASLLEFNEEQEDRTVIYYPRSDSFQIRRQGSELREAGVEIERVYTGEIDGLGKPELKGIRLHFTKPETFIVRGKKVVVEKKGESNEEEDAKEPPSPGVIPPRVA